MLKALALSFVCLMFTGCAFNAQKATFNPIVNVASSNAGKGSQVGLKVDDERPSSSLGHRGNAYGAAAEITTDQDLAALIREKVASGLTKEGYQVVNYLQSSGARLTLELRDLKYSTSTGFWTGGVDVDGAIKAIGSNGGDTYEKLYRTDKKSRVVVVPTAGTNEQWLNEALSDLLRQVFEDPELAALLSRGKPSTASNQTAVPTASFTTQPSTANAQNSTSAAPTTSAASGFALQAKQAATQMGCGDVQASGQTTFTADCGSYKVAIDCGGSTCRPTHTIKDNADQ
jgi:uncharacterized lipoprotein YajG